MVYVKRLDEFLNCNKCWVKILTPFAIHRNCFLRLISNNMLPAQQLLMKLHNPKEGFFFSQGNWTLLVQTCSWGFPAWMGEYILMGFLICIFSSFFFYHLSTQTLPFISWLVRTSMLVIVSFILIKILKSGMANDALMETQI